MQRVLTVESLPESSLEASAVFFSDFLERARFLLGDQEVDSLVIALPQAAVAHDGWRRALARDLARDFAPKRVNVVGGDAQAMEKTLTYLANAPGVTGQYCPIHG